MGKSFLRRLWGTAGGGADVGELDLNALTDIGEEAVVALIDGWENRSAVFDAYGVTAPERQRLICVLVPEVLANFFLIDMQKKKRR